MAVAAVNIKLPPFWPSDPQIWFAQVEAQFTTRHITSQKTKFDYIVASLSPDIATEVQDLVLTPPTDNAYDTLKEQLIQRTAASEPRRLRQLFNTEELGDRKPTQMLRCIQQLLGDKVTATDSSFLRELFLQHLSPNVRMILASTKESGNLEELATLADKISEVVIQPTISTIESPKLSDEVKQLRTEISDLNKIVQSMSPRSNKPSSYRSPSPARPQKPSAELCWYHGKFGTSAQKCKSPCSWSGNAPASH